MSDRFPGKAPATLPRGGGPAMPSRLDRALRHAAARSALATVTAAPDRPPADPGAGTHDIIPELGPGGSYRCATCLLPIIPAYGPATGPVWRHAGPGDPS